ncbi:MAG: PDDEXK nuclease domain-containing protein [Proteobacteria bacterium]|nr:PDDEXK nuclease domain-containing protein [Pseudomonadota bacterium]
MKNQPAIIQEQQFAEILNQIQTARCQAFQQINKTLVQLYWTIGHVVAIQVKKDNWGKSTVEQLAQFIQRQEPNMAGFSARNIWRMKQFYEVYGDNEKLSTLWSEISWSHNRRIMTLKTTEERAFYLHLCSQKKYSFRELERLIKTSTFERTMLADKKMSPLVAELPQSTQSIFKDSYVFEFLDLPIPHKEKDLQQALVASLKDFILELGFGFTFMGQECCVQVGNSDFSIDLLFFHRQLQCLVVFELKNRKFNPADLGQLEFYLEALDQDVKLAHENPSIGVLLCREKDDEVVKYALNRSLSPTVIADYETKLIPKELLRKKLNEFYALLEGGE